MDSNVGHVTPYAIMQYHQLCELTSVYVTDDEIAPKRIVKKDKCDVLTYVGAHEITTKAVMIGL